MVCRAEQLAVKDRPVSRSNRRDVWEAVGGSRCDEVNCGLAVVSGCRGVLCVC